MKLLICDDDISTVDVIQNQLDCQELGITRILRAYNGEAAKEVILREKPELILCDIGMPKCNGIEVLKFLRESKVEAEFAFFTCYESFEFAREAVRYGATNYLSKPLDFEELKETLRNMISVANAKLHARSLAEDQGILDNRINNILRQISNGFFGTDPDRINAVLRRNRIHFTAESCWRLICTTADMSQALKNGWERELLVFSISRLVEEVLADYIGNAYTIVDFGERYISTTCFVPEGCCTEAELVQKCRRLAQLCAHNICVMPTSIVGNAVPLYKASEVAPGMRARCKKLRLQSGAVYRIDETDSIRENIHSLVDDWEILALVKARNRARFNALIGGAVDKIVHSRGDSDAMMAMLHQDLRQAFSRCLQDNNLPARTLFEDEHLRQLDARAENSPADIMLFALELYDQTIAKLQELADSTDIIAGVKSYIHEYFREDINRDTIAAMAYITPNYLSKRFRTEMGMNLREYINQLRIEEAKRLLLSTNDAVSEIASKVGYANISYFSTVFRKLCGMSPIDWRNRTTNGGTEQ